MNTLGHLLAAQNQNDACVGQFLGDHVKGPIEDSSIPRRFWPGLRAHRRLDQASDTHPYCRNFRDSLPNHYRRFGPLILDVLSDYFFHESWPRWSPTCAFEAQEECWLHILEAAKSDFPPSAQRHLQAVRDYGVLGEGASLSGVRTALQRIQRRFRHPTPHLPDAVDHLANHMSTLRKGFPDFAENVFIEATLSLRSQPPHPYSALPQRRAVPTVRDETA